MLPSQRHTAHHDYFWTVSSWSSHVVHWFSAIANNSDGPLWSAVQCSVGWKAPLCERRNAGDTTATLSQPFIPVLHENYDRTSRYVWIDHVAGDGKLLTGFMF